MPDFVFLFRPHRRPAPADVLRTMIAGLEAEILALGPHEYLRVDGPAPRDVAIVETAPPQSRS